MISNKKKVIWKIVRARENSQKKKDLRGGTRKIREKNKQRREGIRKALQKKG